MKTLYFNNFNCHNGDLHYYREFIKDIINKTDFDNYYLLENKSSSKLLIDIPNLKFDKINGNCFINQTYYKINQDVYINIHFIRTDSNYLIIKDNEWFKYNSLLDAYYEYYSFIYNKLSINLDNKNNYIPTINYSKFEIENIDKFIQQNDKFKLLFCNGKVLSGQSKLTLDNIFYIIDKLSDMHKNIDFILTEKIDIIKENILFTDDIINCQLPDLNEISYLSTFCNIILGRTSGPYCFTLTKDNLNDSEKTHISISSNFITSFYTEFSKSDRILITDNDNDKIINSINDEINKKYKLFINKKNIKTLNIIRDNNRLNYHFFGNLYNITILSYVDLNNDGNFDIAYMLTNEKIFENINYFIIINRQLISDSKIKLVFLHYSYVLYEIIL